MQVSKQKVVSIDYTLTDASGTVLDSSKGKAPLTYLHGVGGLIPGLEQALEGREQGEAFQVTIPPELAYGKRNEAMIQPVPRSNFSGVNELKEGMQFQARTPQGNHVVTVTKVEEQTVTVDANHPLAGKPLTFDVNVAEVREPTEEELSHGHVHAESGCGGNCSCGEGGCSDEGCGSGGCGSEGCGCK